jgi:hypothetical protein
MKFDLKLIVAYIKDFVKNLFKKKPVTPTVPTVTVPAPVKPTVSTPLVVEPKPPTAEDILRQGNPQFDPNAPTMQPGNGEGYSFSGFTFKPSQVKRNHIGEGQTQEYLVSSVKTGHGVFKVLESPQDPQNPATFTEVTVNGTTQVLTLVNEFPVDVVEGSFARFVVSTNGKGILGVTFNQ